MTIKQLNILVVDDDESISFLLCEILKLWDHQVTVNNNSIDAIQNLKNQDYDLIFCDMIMPDMNGEEFRKEALNINRNYFSKFIFTTGLTEAQVRQNVSDAFVLEKPFKIKDVKSAIEALILK